LEINSINTAGDSPWVLFLLSPYGDDPAILGYK